MCSAPKTSFQERMPPDGLICPVCGVKLTNYDYLPCNEECGIYQATVQAPLDAVSSQDQQHKTPVPYVPGADIPLVPAQSPSQPDTGPQSDPPARP